MKPAEHGIVDEGSDFYIYTPSRTAQRTFLYPLRTGLFRYEAGYRQERSSFDSFLVMAIRSGGFDVRADRATRHAGAGDFVLLDCYRHHSYASTEPSEVLWLHFDGPTARAYYDLIADRLGNVFPLRDPSYAITRLMGIFDVFRESGPVSEPRMSKLITDVLTEFAVAASAGGPSAQRQSHAVEDVLAYIAAHLADPLPVEELAARAFMSEYHFIRVFKRETGYTPHAYVVDARMHAAKYMLTHSDAPLKRLCEECGFTDPSAFCAAFKRRNGVSPMEFRRRSAAR
ncbi:Helix-turn-helix domain-containing protein [Bifidobacterium sp. DSM 109958]|uniref:Helix-turn-helix domain-containing protein n=1 Tax=Bifidobacterium moraviense TaxID=2675323 RepID=A0A7Y0F3A3_9BIFI|nr:AraC family transcriptional regulator [Bifidobacterium sp. DSM 109958]NMN01099.1 Helix-turn-helix domain-containing protein [Bifidobacterium sp. DSM 109958]